MIADDLKNTLTQWQYWLKHTKGMSSHTVSAYIGDINHFIKFLNSYYNETISLQHCALADLSTFRSWLAERLQNQNICHRSSARAISALRNFFKFLTRYHNIINSQIGLVRLPKLRPTLPRPLSVEEVFNLLKVAGENKDWLAQRDVALFALLYGTGMRISEGLSLNQSILPLGSRLIIKAKRNRDHQVPLLPFVIEQINSYIDICPYFAETSGESPVFFGAQGGRLSAAVAQKQMRNLRYLLNLPDTATPHALRHSCASHLLREGANLIEIQELLGHQSLRSTQVYAEADLQHLLQVHKRAYS